MENPIFEIDKNGNDISIFSEGNEWLKKYKIYDTRII
jgi:hypothetical protein